MRTLWLVIGLVLVGAGAVWVAIGVLAVAAGLFFVVRGWRTPPATR